MSKKMVLALGTAVMATIVSLSAPIQVSQAAETKRSAGIANILGLPLHVGKVQLSCPFLKVSATITEATKNKVVFASSFKNITIVADASRPGGVSLDYGSDKMKGNVEKGTNSTVLSIDNIGKFTISMTDSNHFVISGGLPFNLYVNFVD